MARKAIRGGSMPHATHGIDPPKVPGTYIEPFVAYRVWNWTTEGLTSLNREPWTPKIAFEAKCHYADRLRSVAAAAPSSAAKRFWERHSHHAPEPSCTCGMYAGLSMQHLIDIDYIGRGIHGEVILWGRLYRHTLGWRAQFAYPKHFVVPASMIPVRADEAQQRLKMLTEFDVDIYLQPDREARVGQRTIPLWVKDYGYSAQGVEFLVERWNKWNSTKITHTLAVGDRLAVFSDFNGGIGVVCAIEGDDVYYTLFSPNVIYHKRVKDVVWNERNWRWETSGLGSMRRVG